MERLLTIDRAEFDRGYGRAPFRVSHRLTEHPLLSVDALGDLADFLPAERVEQNRADVPEILPSGEAAKLEATPGEIARGIETNGAWMVLKHIELHPDYNRLLDEALDEVMPFVRDREGEMEHRVGFIFMTSPGGTTPAHTDPEHNFLLQVRGWKEMTVAPWATKTDEQAELEQQMNGKHRNVHEMPVGAEAFRLDPGDGLYVPIHAPHLVRNGDQVSVSLSITWHTPVSKRELMATSVNARLRKVKGVDPALPGERPLSDKVKAGALRVAHKVRGSEFN